MFQWVFKCVVFCHKLTQFCVARMMHGVRIKAQVTAGIYCAICGKIYFLILFVYAEKI
jgi:hypothetical protein